MASYTQGAAGMAGTMPILETFSTLKLGDMSAVTINSIATVLTPTSGKKLVIVAGEFSVSADASVLFEDNSAATANFVYRSPLLAAKTPWRFYLGNGKALSAADNVLKATGSASCTITGIIWYYEV